MNSKNELRREMIKTRQEKGKKEWGEKIARYIKDIEEYKKAKSVMVYMPIKNEVDITELCGDDKTFLTPVTKGEDMYACLLQGEMANGAFNVPEPTEKTVFDKQKIDVVIVPAVAFDKDFNRMGYGKGYYDKFLKDISAYKIGVCYSFQLLDTIPALKHDVKMDMIITENRIWKRENIL